MVLSSTASSTAWGVMIPSAVGGRSTVSKPVSARCFTGASTDSCSMAVVITLLPRRRAAIAPPRMARLFPSLPQEVKNSSSPRAPSTSASSRRAEARACSAKKPRRWREEGFPYSSRISSKARLAAPGLTLVVALLSR